MADGYEDRMPADVALDLTAQLTKIERIMGGMPYGGTYFHQPTHSSRGLPIAQRLRNIEQNLDDLRNGLQQTSVRNSQIESEHDEMRRDIEGFGRLIARATGGRDS